MIVTPFKIEALKQIDTQFVRIDFVDDSNLFSKFGENPPTEPSGEQVKYNILVTYLFFLGPMFGKK